MAKRKKRRNSRKRAAGFLLFLLLVLLAAGAVLSSVFFKITTVTVTGDPRYAPEDIVELARIPAGQNILTLSEKAVTERLQPEYPYIERVEIVRRLPDTVELRIHEYGRLLASINGQGRITVLSGSGRVLEQGAELPSCLALILGSDFSACPPGESLGEADQALLETLNRLTGEAEKCGLLDRIGYFNLSDDKKIRFLLDGRILVNLGTEYRARQKLLTAAALADRELPGDFTGTLNVSAPGRAFSRELPLSEIADTQYLALAASA